MVVLVVVVECEGLEQSSTAGSLIIPAHRFLEDNVVENRRCIGEPSLWSLEEPLLEIEQNSIQGAALPAPLNLLHQVCYGGAASLPIRGSCS